MNLHLAPRVQAIVLLLLVATSGALAGIVGDRLLSERQPAEAAAPAADGTPWRWQPRLDVRYGERLYGALELSVAQQEAIDAIVAEQQVRVRELNDEVRPRFRAIAEQTRDRIEGVLTEEQRERLRTLREERLRAMQENRRLRGVRPDGEPPAPLRDGRLRERLPRDPAVRDSLLRERARMDPAQRDSLRRERLRRRLPPEDGRPTEPAADAPAADTLTAVRPGAPTAPRRTALSI